MVPKVMVIMGVAPILVSDMQVLQLPGWCAPGRKLFRRSLAGIARQSLEYLGIWCIHFPIPE